MLTEMIAYDMLSWTRCVIIALATSFFLSRANSGLLRSFSLVWKELDQLVDHIILTSVDVVPLFEWRFFLDYFS